MTGRRERYKSEYGAVQIVEAAIVFPVMFFILFFLIFMGNAYYVKAQVESIVARYAVTGAAYCADPILQTIRETGSVPSLTDLKIKPYRYLFGGMDGIEQDISTKVKNEIESSTTSFFRGMVPVVKTRRDNIAKFNNYVIYSTFSVEVSCEVGLPIRMFGSNTPLSLTLSSRTEVAVNDATEFIRNTDMVIDYFEDSKLGSSIKSVFDKINGFMSSFAAR